MRDSCAECMEPVLELPAKEQDACFGVKKAKEVSGPDNNEIWTAKQGGTAET